MLELNFDELSGQAAVVREDLYSVTKQVLLPFVCTRLFIMPLFQTVAALGRWKVRPADSVSLHGSGTFLDKIFLPIRQQ